MNEFNAGKLGSPDPEDLARAHLTKTVTPPLPFDKLVASVKQARTQGPVYDGTWTVLEALVMEVASLKEEIASLKSQE
jgi:histone H3/H4